MPALVMVFAKIDRGNEEAFEAAYAEVTSKVKGTKGHIADELLRRAPGNVRQALMRDPDDPNTFMVTSDWESRDAFTQFERSPEQDDLTAPLRELRESGRMKVHELVTHIEGGGA